jgi:tripartite-type tricarboxylate transporter receptor subunit TctC
MLTQRLVFAWLACTMSLAALVTSAEAVTDFYQGKSVHVLVGYAVGGGYDTYGRAVAQVLGRHLPGNPSVLVQNMPGADGLLLANHMAQRAPHDGTAIAVTNRSLAVSPLLGLVSASNIRYEPTKLQWLASLNSEVSLLIVRKELGIRRLEDLQGRPIRVGSTGLTSNNAVYPYVLNNLFGTQVKVVTGYPGTSHLALALERNEIDGVAGWAWSSLRLQRPDWIRDGKVVLVLQLGTERVPELKDVPLILDLARSDDERHALELIFSPETMGRPFFAPPQTPKEAVTLLRNAFAATVEDPEFRSVAERSGLDITFTGGDTIQRMVARLNAARPEVVQMAQRVMQP